MNSTLQLALFNAEKEEIEALLIEAQKRYSALCYDTLHDFGRSEKVHSLRLVLLDMINEFTSGPFEESDFPDEFGATAEE